jgi:DNA-binding beta-propeller fold protein YncE
VQSRANANVLYVGELESGGVGTIDRAQAVRTGEIGIPWSGTPENPEYVFDLAVLAGDTKLYLTRYLDGGVIVANPATGAILSRIGVGGAGWPDSGRTDAFVLSHDDQHLYVAVLDGNPRGVVDIYTVTDRVVRTLPLFGYVPQELALSPDGTRLFVTTQDRVPTEPSENVLIDIPTWQVIARFPRPRVGTLRFDGGVAFHPNGKLIFVGRDRMIDVYLERE